MEKSIDNTRRDFLTTVAAGSICFLCAGGALSLLAGCAEEESNPLTSTPATDDPVIDLTKETALQNVGGAVKKRIPSVNSGRTIIVVRTGSESFAALSAQCTHQGTEVNLPSNNVIICPNHGSRYNASTGGVVQGPAAASLTSFPAVYNANANTVTIG